MRMALFNYESRQIRGYTLISHPPLLVTLAEAGP